MGTDIMLYTDKTLVEKCQVPTFLTGNCLQSKVVTPNLSNKMSRESEPYVIPITMDANISLSTGYAKMFNEVLQDPSGNKGYWALNGNVAGDLIFCLKKAKNALNEEKSGDRYRPKEGEAREILETLLEWAVLHKKGVFYII